ncbi:MAG TPA: hypothetical protein VGK61_07010 [Planctomycetota bacterium]|jgi:hypothetical protein
MAKLMVVAALAMAFAPAADEDLDKAAAKAAEMGNYSCKIATKMEGGGGGGATAAPVELQIKPDAPWHIKSGETEAYRKGEALAVKDKETWKKLERPEGGQGGGRPDRATMNAFRLRGVRAPHEILKDLKSDQFKEVKREDAEGGRCFSGDLTAEAAKKFGAVGGGRRGGGGGGDRPPEGEYSGRAKVWVNGDGAVTKYEIYTEGKVKVREEERTIKRTVTVEISDVGSTKYEVPEDAAKALEGKTVEK